MRVLLASHCCHGLAGFICHIGALKSPINMSGGSANKILSTRSLSRCENLLYTLVIFRERCPDVKVKVSTCP